MEDVSTSLHATASRVKFPQILQRAEDDFEKFGLHKIAKVRYRNTGGRFLSALSSTSFHPCSLPLYARMEYCLVSNCNAFCW